MPSLPEGWKLTERKRSDGRVDIVGKDDLGQEYLARTTETDGVTDKDLKILNLTNREKSTAKDVVDFYAGEKQQAEKQWQDSFTDDCMAAAEPVVNAGLHLSESRVGYSRRFAQAWERLEKKGYV